MSDSDAMRQEGAMPLGRDIVATAVANVQRDVVEAFKGMLSPLVEGDDGVKLELHDPEPTDGERPRAPLAKSSIWTQSDALVAVPWLYETMHTGNFLGVPATYNPVNIRGTTFVDVREADAKRWRYHRYIDFLGALNQMGVGLATRPALDDSRYAVWQENRRGNAS